MKWQYYRNYHISPEMHYQITFVDRGELALLEKCFGLLQVKDATPHGFSQQYVANKTLE